MAQQPAQPHSKRSRVSSTTTVEAENEDHPQLAPRPHHHHHSSSSGRVFASTPPAPLHPTAAASTSSTAVGAGAAAAVRKYRRNEKIGGGAYGNVYLGESLASGAVVVLKIIQSRPEEEDGLSSNSLREIGVLKTIKHANIVTLMDVETYSPRTLCLVFEPMECDLAKYIAQSRTAGSGVAVPAARQIMRQVLLGLVALHSRSYFHRDLKPANILINSASLQVKLADFGLAQRYMRGRLNSMQVCTRPYRSPELWLGLKTYTLAVDVWAAGCVLAELEGGQPFGLPLFVSRSQWVDKDVVGEAIWLDQLMCIFAKLGTPAAVEDCPGYCAALFPQWPKPAAAKLLGERLGLAVAAAADSPSSSCAVVSLLEGMLRIDHGQRITAQQALDHEYFQAPLTM